MGFTGKKAAAWKEAYINAFNQMEKRLQHIFDPMVIEYRKEQLSQVERLVKHLDNTLDHRHWEITEIFKVMVLQFSRELLLACQDKVMLEDRTKAFEEMGISVARKVDHPTVILFWDQIRKIGLPLVNRSMEDGLMCISPRLYLHWCKTLGIKPVASVQELDDTFRHSIDFPYFAVKNILLNHFSSLRVAQNIFTRHGHLAKESARVKGRNLAGIFPTSCCVGGLLNRKNWVLIISSHITVYR